MGYSMSVDVGRYSAPPRLIPRVSATSPNELWELVDPLRSSSSEDRLEEIELVPNKILDYVAGTYTCPGDSVSQHHL